MNNRPYERNEAHALRILREYGFNNNYPLALRIAKELGEAEKRGVERFLTRLKGIVEESETE